MIVRMEGPEFRRLCDSLREVQNNGRLIGNSRRLPLYVQSKFVSILADTFPTESALPLPADAALNEPGIVLETEPADFAYSNRSAEGISFFQSHYPTILTRVFDTSARIASDEEIDLSEGLILFHSPRTGSHYLQSVISAIDGFAATEEWIRPPIVLACRSGITDLYSHLRSCIARQLPRARRWSFTVDCRSLQRQWTFLSPHDQRRILALMSCAHRFVLTRRDRVAQAWSDIKAISTGVFFRLTQDQGTPYQPVPTEPERYWFWVHLLIRQNVESERWLHSLLTANRLAAPTVTYEDILSDEGLKENAPAILGPYLGRTAEELRAGASQFEKQSTEQDACFIRRLHAFIAEERLFYPAEYTDLCLLGDASFGPQYISIRGPLGGIAVHTELRAEGTLYVDFALPGLSSVRAITVSINCNHLLDTTLAAAKPHALFVHIPQPGLTHVVITFRLDLPEGETGCCVHRVSFVPGAFARRQAYPWADEPVVTTHVHLITYTV